jgi:tRNA pseudouridine55 synthase
MSRAKGDIGLDGFLNLCKPSGPTSHDMVAAARRLLGTRRIGHAGTLDPLAEGVLPLALGRATRLIDRLAEADKEYYTEALLGVRTSTDDAEGELLESRAVPRFDASELDAALAAFVGEIDQVPPGYSALKVGGRRAYELARAGREVTLSARRVTIYEIERRRWEWPVLSFRLRCSKGTYVRALARDLGERLGVGASLRRLVRLRVGPFHLAQAVEVAELEAGRAGLVWPADALSLGEPAGVLGQPELEHLRHGRSWRSDGRTAPQARAYVADGRFVGLLAGHGDRWQPRLHFLD